MPLTINTIWAHCRVQQARRAVVTEELCPGGLIDLKDFTTADIKEAIKGFKSLPNNPFCLTAGTTKRLTQLALWAKDRVRLNQQVEFANGTSQAQLFRDIEGAQDRDKIRGERKKNAETLATLKIDPPLKAGGGWDAWTVAIKTALTIAYGSKGVPLLYVLRENEAPEHIGATWEELAINSAPHTGLDFEADVKTVHLLILNNISEDSDAHAYIQPLVRQNANNGRRDWLALHDRYENAASVQARVNAANKTWESLVYKNERVMSFEAFSKKLTTALQDFERALRPKHEGDIIDWLWRHVQNLELTQLMSALKVAQTFQNRTSQQILHEIAKEIPNLSKGSDFSPRGVSDVHQVDQLSQISGSDWSLDKSDTPSAGAHTTDGKLFCGKYPGTRWWDEDVKPFHSQIIEIRNKHQPEQRGSYGGGSGGGRASKRAKRQIKALEKTNEKLKMNVSSMKAGQAQEDTATPAAEKEDKAGNAFGGKSSMQKKKDGEE
jgi:hypothetical protein